MGIHQTNCVDAWCCMMERLVYYSVMVIEASNQEGKGMNTHSYSFGDYQATLRVNGRAAIGIGHTPGEAWRNACDCHSNRNELLQGAMAVMRKMPPRNIERVSAEHRA